MMATGQKNDSVKFSVLIIMVFLLCMLTASWIATQYLAAKLGYQPGLGDALFSIQNKIKIYQPYSWFFWNIAWINEEGVLRDYITHAQMIVEGGAFLSVVIGLWLFYWRSGKKETIDDLHGSARFANSKDIEKMGLVKNGGGRSKGVYIGAFDFPGGRKVLRYNEAAHILGCAPTRSGKGVGLVLPTLLSYPDSTATNDIKGENFELTSGFRHLAGSLCIRFDPTSLNQKSIDGKSQFNIGARWNVLDEVRIWTERDVMDAQNIASAIADPDGKGMDDHWVSTSYELLTGVILHNLYFERDKSLTGVATYLADPSFTDPEQMFLRMLDAEHDPEGRMGWLDSSGKPTKTHPQVAIAARAILNKEQKEQTSVLSTAKTKLGLFSEPIVARNTARSDFCIQDLMNHDKPVSLYLVVPPSDKERLRPLIRLFISFMIRRLTEKMDFEDGASVKGYRHRLLLLIDELPSLRKLDVLQDGLSYIAGYGITAYLIIQDLIQLKEAYGDKQAIVSGCHVRVVYAPNTVETAEEISKMTGVTTIKKQNVSYSGSRFKALNQMSVSEELVQRPLMTTDEVMTMNKDDSLVFLAGNPVIRGKKLRYFEMSVFQDRAKIQPPSRVEMTHKAVTGEVCSKWFMVLVERIEGEANLKATINCYSDFPKVHVTVKQESDETGEVMEYEFDMLFMDNQLCDRGITIDDQEFMLRFKGAAGFNPLEFFEVHFQVVDAGNYQLFSQLGFFRMPSVYEKEVRDLVKNAFKKNDVDVNFDVVVAGSVFSGIAILETEHYLVLQRSQDSVSLHRKSRLSKPVSTKKQHVSIKYDGRKGVVL